MKFLKLGYKASIAALIAWVFQTVLTIRQLMRFSGIVYKLPADPHYHPLVGGSKITTKRHSTNKEPSVAFCL